MLQLSFLHQALQVNKALAERLEQQEQLNQAMVEQTVLDQALQVNKALAERLEQQEQLNQAMVEQTVLDQALRVNNALVEQQKQEHQAALEDLMCPITCELMDDPVIAEDGQTYEREAIATWVAGHGTSPMTRQRMANMLIPNRTVKTVINRMRKQSAEGLT
jgi:hypothetical protein